MTRKILSIVLIVGALVFGAVTLTVPAIAATAPAIITVACAVCAWLVWPKKKAESEG